MNNISGKILKEEHVGRLYGDFNMAHYHLERNGNAKFIFTDLSMNVTRLMAKIS